MRNNQKGFVNLILVGVVVLLVAVGGYFLWKKNHPVVLNTPEVTTVPSQDQTQTQTKSQNNTSGISVSAVTTPGIQIGKVPTDPTFVAAAQKGVDEGHEPWQLDPKSVAELAIYSQAFSSTATENAIQTISVDTKNGVAIYVMPFQGKKYEVTLNQPAGVGANKIWVVTDIEYAK